MFGYGFGISDVRVTLADGTEVDCVQKIYEIGRHVAAGFAGSVIIGFAMLDELRKLTKYEDERMACDPLAIAADLPEYAQNIFASFPSRDRDNQCHLMVISAHPTEHVGNPNWPRSHVHIFKSPRFEAQSIPVHTLGSIGCGSAYEPCRQILESFSTDHKRRDFFTQGEVGVPGGMATLVGNNLTTTLKKVQPKGVSAHLHYCWVYRGRTIISTNYHVTSGRWTISGLGSRVDVLDEAANEAIWKEAAAKDGFVFEMPRLATSWVELERILDARGASARGCRT
jgi:hypothetical protein